jgi:hypothetical protein
MKTFAPTKSQVDTPEATPDAGRLFRRKCACGQHTIGGSNCAACAKKEEGLQRRAAHQNDSAHERSGVPESMPHVLGSAGQPLQAGTRAFMESRFGHDSSRVRVHTNAQAAESARAVNALAYTVGHNIAFGDGQYDLGTTAGRRLLAHELAHVVQQEQFVGAAIQHKLEISSPDAPAELEADNIARNVVEGTSAESIQRRAPCQSVHRGMIQRTPAPPDYGGVTGVRDLSKLRIDPVPDIETSMFIFPKMVHPHVTDRDVAHIEWMLYDPNDRMVAGFTTFPNKPNSKTMPFELEPSHLSGAGVLKGVMGKYILRCSGLNAKHQPIVYADRGITVVKADLTTGTDLATTYGKLTFTKYTKTDANPPSSPNYKVEVAIKFMPNSNKITCDDVAYIQAIESVDDTGKSQHRFNSPEQEARQTPLAWTIDRVAGGPTPFYGTKKDDTGAITIPLGSGKSGKGGATPAEATLIDTPQWSQATHDKFESCVICRTGTNKGQVYGCATWGFTVDANAKVRLDPRSFRQTPSDQFKEARDAWNTWRATVAAGKRPEEAPALKKP